MVILHAEKNKSKWKRSFSKVCLFFLMVVFGGMFFVVNTNAETNPEGCNAGDKVTVEYSEVDDNNNLIEPRTVEVTVGGEGTIGGNFAIAIGCFGEEGSMDEGSYAFTALRVKNNSDGESLPAGADGNFTLDEIKDGKAYRVVNVNGVNVYFAMKEVEQKGEDTSVSEHVYDPTQSIDTNTESGNVQVVDDSLDIPSEDKTCQEAKGAENIGWLVCPILTWMGNAAADVYDNYVQPSLEVGPELFSGGGGTRQAWDVFRNFGNIIFIILLLAVIFSQVTGIGIDNYGIKKILPKLIIAAVLINISYVICVFLVDISNILGNGFQALFSNISGGDTIVVSAPEGSAFVKDGVEQGSWEIGSILAGVGLLAGVVTLIGAIWLDPSILVSILVAALGVAVAIFFLFLLLAARKAAIIVLTVLSPVAVACYVMPNAKSLYDKWWNIFKAMLLVYPIAGLLMGGGDFVSRLLLRNSSDFFSWFTAMVIGVVPIFFIPVVLKSAFAAMGKIGGMLAGMGASARKKATGAMRGSNTYNQLRKAGADRKNFKTLQKRSGLDKNGRERKSIRNKLARSRVGRAMGLDTAMGRTRNDYMKAKQERMSSVAGMNMDVQNAKILEAQHNIEEQRNIAANKVELGAKPTIRPEKLRVQMQNEMNQALAENSDQAIPLPISYETALANKQAQQSMQLTKMYADNYAKETDLLKVDSAFKNSINSGNSESAVAAMKELLGRGGTAQVLEALEKANWAGMNRDFKNQLAQAMGSSGVDALKSYSKYLSTGGSAGFQDWSTGNIDEGQIRKEAAAGVKDGTYIQHLMEGGANAMLNFDKDQMKFIAGRADAIRSGVGDDAFGAMIKNVAVKSGDAKTKTEAEKVITSQLSGGGLNVSNLGITGEDLGYMRGETALAIRAGVGDSGELAKGLSDSIEKAEKDAVTMARMDSVVANTFGVNKKS